ncbi:MAG: hypothetical protein RBU37_20195 [Myxococcota bacterium]|nr:hypothetical protein [Myxococcota bacterium]
MSDEQKPTPPPASEQPSNVLNIIEKIGEQLSRVGANLNSEAGVSQWISKIQHRTPQAPSAEAEAEAVKEETANVINLAIEKLKRSRPHAIDIKAIVKAQTIAFVEKKQIAPRGEPPRLSIDGEFLAQHGREFIPTVLAAAAQALFTPQKEGEEQAAVAPPPYEIEVDVASVLAVLVKPIAELAIGAMQPKDTPKEKSETGSAGPSPSEAPPSNEETPREGQPT